MQPKININEAKGVFKPSCFDCSGTGWFSAIERETGLDFAFKCASCRSATMRGLSEIIPFWSSRQLQRFEPYFEWQARGGWKDHQQLLTNQ